MKYKWRFLVSNESGRIYLLDKDGERSHIELYNTALWQGTSKEAIVELLRRANVHGGGQHFWLEIVFDEVKP